MATQEQNDPFAKFRIGESKEDPFAKYRENKIETKKNESKEIKEEKIIQEPIQEEDGIVDWLTSSILPEINSRPSSYDDPNLIPPFPVRALGEIGLGAYEDIIRPMASPLGAGLSLAGGPLARGALKIASKIPGVNKIGELLGTKLGEAEAPSFIKKTVESLTPKGPRIKSEVLPEPVTNVRNEVIEEAPKTLTPIDKLLTKVKESKPLEEKQAKIYSIERSGKIKEAEKVTTSGQKGFYERKAKLAGEHSKVQMEPLQLEQPDVDSLFDDIAKSALEPFQRINAGSGLEKVLNGQVPQASEMHLLSKVFGEDRITELATALPKIKKNTLLHEAINIPRAMQTVWDLSMPLRQGKTMLGRDWLKAWPSMVKSFGSEKAYRGVMDSITSRPNFSTKVLPDGTKAEPFFRKAGLHLTDLTDLSSREESMMSPLVEKFMPFARASNRGAVAFVNKLRADGFDRLIASADKAGLNPYENLDLSANIASFLNNATGRGSLGPAEKYAVALNDTLFSPRFIASRINMLNPTNYMKLNTPEGRMVSKQYWKSMAGLTAAWLAELKMMEYAGAEVNLDDPTSSDFAKAKWGDTTFDPGAGFQQYIVLLSRLANQSYKTAGGNEREYGRGFGSKTMFNAIEEFVTNKLAPVPKYFVDAAKATEYRPFDVGDKTVRLVTPMIMQDLSELAQEDPTLLPLLGGAFLGESIQVTSPEESKIFGEGVVPEFEFPIKRGVRR